MIHKYLYMKKISLLALFTLLVCSIQAQGFMDYPQGTYLSLATERSNEQFFVSINGILQNDVATPNITLMNIPEGTYNILISFNNPEKEKFSTKLSIHPGMNDYYITRYTPKNHKFFLRNVDYALNTNLHKPFIRDNRPHGQNNGHVNQPPHPGGPTDHQHGPGMHDGNRPPQGHPDGHPHSGPGEMHPHPDAPSAHHGAHQNPPMRPCGSAPEQFARIKMAIEHENFSSEKLALAKQMISMDPMSSSQIAEIAAMLTFEKDKLEFLKFGYHYCCDIDKYGIVYHVLDFNSSKQELKKYIRDAR